MELNKFYNHKNRVEISVTKRQLKQMSREIQIPENELNELIKTILTKTHSSVIEELIEWIDLHVPLLSEVDIIKYDNDEDSYDYTIEDFRLRDCLKDNFASAHLRSPKEGRFYRIRFGLSLIAEIVHPSNEDENKEFYHYIERMIDFAYNRTIYHLEENYKRFCPNSEVRDYLNNKLEIICKRD